MKEIAHAVSMVEDPMSSFSKLIEYEGGWAWAEGKSQVDLELIVPGHSEKMTIMRVDGDQTIGISDVDFG